MTLSILVECCYAVSFLLTVVYAHCLKLALCAGYHYAKCHYAECRCAKFFPLSPISQILNLMLEYVSLYQGSIS